MSRERTNLLITGYVRNIGSNVIKSTVIPVEIIELFILFYPIPIKIFLQINPWGNNFHITQFHSKMITKLDVNKPEEAKNVHFSADNWCYIDNISSMIQCNPKNKTFDGIFGIFQPDYHREPSSFRHCILLFPSDQLFVNDVVESKLFISKIDAKNEKYGRHIFCGKENGIIYANSDDLQQLKLENVDLSNDDEHKFNIDSYNITTNMKEIFKLNVVDHEEYDYLSMCYLSNNNQIFAMKCCDYNDNLTLLIRSLSPLKTQQRVCGIFDFNDCKWRRIKNYQHKGWDDQKEFSASICHNNIDMNNIFVLDYMGGTAKYDCYKNQWITYYQVTENDLRYKSAQYSQHHRLWFDNDPFVLYCCCSSYYLGNFECFDIRENNGKWKPLNHWFIKDKLNTTSMASIDGTSISSHI